MSVENRGEEHLRLSGQALEAGASTNVVNPTQEAPTIRQRVADLAFREYTHSRREEAAQLEQLDARARTREI
jgi:hypothetical protein